MHISNFSYLQQLLVALKHTFFYNKGVFVMDVYIYIYILQLLVSEGLLVGLGNMLPVIGLGVYVISSID